MTTPLIEACARAIRGMVVRPGGYIDCEDVARAVIPLVLDAAAEVARDKADEFNHQEAMANCDDLRSGYWAGRKGAERSILALKPEAQS